VTQAPDWRDFLAQEQLPAEFADDIERHYRPLARRLAAWHGDDMRLLGISGGQGSGKSTVARLLSRLVGDLHGLRCVVLSLDDFYLERAARLAVAQRVHPLFATRGVPGTHDLPLLNATLDALLHPQSDGPVPLPRFDKARDDRLPPVEWSQTAAGPDLVLLEGWCVGVPAESAQALREPVNELESREDPDARWRRAVNEYLEGPYGRLWARLDRLLYLRVPDFDAVRRWRLQQARGQGETQMDEQAVARFTDYYRRLTLRGLATLPERADICVELSPDHRVHRVLYRAS
jgi:D-glycerate 3-kinase